MLRHWEFQLPTRIHFGRGRLKELGKLAAQWGRAALLVGYRDQTGLEATYDRAAQALRDAGVSVRPFLEVVPDPDAKLLLDGAERAKQVGADLVIGLGGGSPIDAAKGIAALARTAGDLWDYAAANPDSRPIDEALPVVAVPTTAGTGSEVSSVAVFTYHGPPPSAELPLKTFLWGATISPKIALVDPELTVGSPPPLAAACGADALGHAIDAYVSRAASPISSLLAGRALSLIVENLHRAVEEPHDPRPREPLALAATLAGAAFSEAGVVVTHAIAHALGAVLRVPHGVGVAIALPSSLRYNADGCRREYSELAAVCGITADSPQEQAARFVDQITAILRSIGLPDRAEVPAGDSVVLVDKLVRSALAGTPGAITLNPRKMDEAGLRAVFGELLRERG